MITTTTARLIGSDDISWGTASLVYTDVNGVVHTVPQVNASQMPTLSGDTVETALGTWVRLGSLSITTDTTIPASMGLRAFPGDVLTIPAGKTLTINGPFVAGSYQIFTGSGSVVFGQPNRVGDLNVLWWGATGLGVADDQPYIQKAIDCSIASGGGLNVYLPAGTYKILDTIKLGNSYLASPAWFHGLFHGDNSKDTYATIIDATGFGDRPAINLQGNYRSRLGNFYLIGSNFNVIHTMLVSTPHAFKPLVTDWVDAGCKNYRYAPYAGICVGGYCGTQPVGGAGNEPYPNDDYAKTWNSGVTMDNVWVRGFVAGVCVNPSNDEQQNDAVTMRECWIDYCTFGFSSGGSQSRSLQMYSQYISQCWAAMVNTRHGAQDGNMPSVHGGIIQMGWKMMEKESSSNPHIIEGVHTEDLVWLGECGAVASAAWDSPTTFSGCELGRNNLGTYQSPFWLIANNPVNFNGCSLYGAANDHGRVWNIVGGGKVNFNGCGYENIDSTKPNFFGVAYGTGFTMLNFRDCQTGNMAPGLPDLNREIFVDHLSNIDTYTVGQGMARLTEGYSSASYHVTHPNRYGYAAAPVTVNPVSVGSAKGSTITFTAFEGTDFKTGDIMLWKAIQPVDTAHSNVIPAFKITNVAGNVVTAVSLFDGLDTTYDLAANDAWIATPQFFNGTESTGDTHTNTTVDNVTTIANWAIGDYIRGAGILADTRIVNIVGTTITLSKAANATAAGVALYNCRLTAY
ncbi:glycoside hydrolase family 55 protein [bacterium]|nr:glycoside hydrolase family 55 protein [bacterium]